MFFAGFAAASAVRPSADAPAPDSDGKKHAGQAPLYFNCGSIAEVNCTSGTAPGIMVFPVINPGVP